MQILIRKLIIILVLILIGYVGARRGFFSKSFTKTASSLTMNVLLTGTVLSSVMGELPELSGPEFARMFLISCSCMLIMGIVGFLCALPFRKNRDKVSIVEFLSSTPNIMFIAAPLVQELYGAQGLFYIVVSTIPFNFFVYTYGVWLVAHGGEGRKLELRDILTLPFLASILALFIALLRLPTPPVLRDLCSIIGGATVPMSMFVIGATLGEVELKSAFAQPLSYAASLVRLIICPVVIYLALRPFAMDPVLFNAMIINAASPSAVIVAVFAIQYDRDAEFAAEGILVSVLLSVVTIPIISSMLLV